MKSFVIQEIDGYQVNIKVMTIERIIGRGDLVAKEVGEGIHAATAITLLQETNTIASKYLEQFGLIGELVLNSNI